MIIFGPDGPQYNCFRSTFYKTNNKLRLFWWSHHCIVLTKEKMEGASATLLKHFKRTLLSSIKEKRKKSQAKKSQFHIIISFKNNILITLTLRSHQLLLKIYTIVSYKSNSFFNHTLSCYT